LAAWISIAVFVVAVVVWLVLDWNNIPGYFSSDKQSADVVQVDKKTTPKKAEAKKALKNTEQDKVNDQKPEGAKKAEQDNKKTAANKKSTVKPKAEAKKEKQASKEIKTKALAPAKKYHLVAGVFGEEANADKMVVKLKKEGYPASKLGPINNKYFVTHNSFEKKADAKYELKRLYDSGIETWLYFY
jgi:cell division protein FtsN